MKKTYTHIIACLFILLITAVNVTAQGAIQERIRSEKIGHITSNVDLTPEEAVNFWPVYNKYDDLREENRAAMRSFIINRSGSYDQNLTTYLKLRDEEVRIEKEMMETLRTIISEDKILKLIRAEFSFKRELMRKVKRKIKDRRSRN